MFFLQEVMMLVVMVLMVSSSQGGGWGGFGVDGLKDDDEDLDYFVNEQADVSG